MSLITSNKPPLPRLKKGATTILLPIYDENIIVKNKENQKCSPIFSFQNSSCIPLKFLIKMAQTYNEQQYTDKNGNMDQIPIMEVIDKNYENEYKIHLLKEFQDRFGNNQQNWVQQEFMNFMSQEYQIFSSEYLFRPEGPNKGKDWLSQVDIDNVIQQYEILHPNFHYLGCLPADHYKLDRYETKNINFDKLKEKGITKFAYVVNDEKHYQRGHHWRMLYFDTEKGYIYFVDSVGDDPIDDDKAYIDIVKKYLESKGIPVIYKVNKTEHQKGNSNCGVYGIYFTEQFLNGKTFEEITGGRVPDSVMDKYRDIYFSSG